MFRRKKYTHLIVIRWDGDPDRDISHKIQMTVNTIKPFKKTWLGVKNPPASLGYVSDAMDVRGVTKDPTVKYKDICFLVPEFEIEELHSGDEIILWIAKNGYCAKFEKITRLS